MESGRVTSAALRQRKIGKGYFSLRTKNMREKQFSPRIGEINRSFILIC
jgi:hypothetical protein